jgi:hypothetical protein
MSSTQRVIACIAAGLITWVILGSLGLKSSGTVAAAIGITAMITQAFRSDKNE